MGLTDQGPYGVGGPITPLDLVPPGHVVTVYEAAGFDDGDGMRIQLAGGWLRVDARLDGVEGTAWCTIERLLDALVEHTHVLGS